MTDMKQYYTHESHLKPQFISDSDQRNWISDCTCSVCKRGKRTTPQLTKEDWSNFYVMSATSELSSTEYLLCPSEIPAFIFRTRTWGKYNNASLRLLCELISSGLGRQRICMSRTSNLHNSIKA